MSLCEFLKKFYGFALSHPWL